MLSSNISYVSVLELWLSKKIMQKKVVRTLLSLPSNSLQGIWAPSKCPMWQDWIVLITQKRIVFGIFDEKFLQIEIKKFWSYWQSLKLSKEEQNPSKINNSEKFLWKKGRRSKIQEKNTTTLFHVCWLFKIFWRWQI